MHMNYHIAARMDRMAPSGIRKVNEKALAMERAGERVLHFEIGRPDFDTPEYIKKAANQALAQGKVHYTSNFGMMELRQAIADKLKRENHIDYKASEVLVTVGLSEAVFAVLATLLDEGDEILVPDPVWLNYINVPNLLGARAVTYSLKEENGYQMDFAEIRAKITPKTRAVVIVTPNNPTGGVLEEDVLKELASIVQEHDLMVIADEIYEKLTYDADKPHVSIASLSDEINEHVITVNGFSKTYAMTGWRLGYLRASRWLARRIIAFQSHATSNATTFAQYGAIAALEGKADKEVARMCAEFAKRRDLVYNLVSAIPGVKCIRPQGAFYLLCDVSSFGMTSEEFCNRLLAEEKLAVIPCCSFGAEGQIRLSYACSEENIREAARRLEIFCREHCS